MGGRTPPAAVGTPGDGQAKFAIRVGVAGGGHGAQKSDLLQPVPAAMHRPLQHACSRPPHRVQSSPAGQHVPEAVSVSHVSQHSIPCRRYCPRSTGQANPCRPIKLHGPPTSFDDANHNRTPRAGNHRSGRRGRIALVMRL
jgi:hypothetical protein